MPHGLSINLNRLQPRPPSGAPSSNRGRRRKVDAHTKLIEEVLTGSVVKKTAVIYTHHHYFTIIYPLY